MNAKEMTREELEAFRNDATRGVCVNCGEIQPWLSEEFDDRVTRDCRECGEIGVISSKDSVSTLPFMYYS